MTISRHALFGKLGGTLYHSVEAATRFCKLRGNPYVELVHWLHQLLQQPDNDLHRIIQHAHVERDSLERDIVRTLDALPCGMRSIQDFSPHIEAAIERAWVLSTLCYAERRIRSAWLIAALVGAPELHRVLCAISPAFSKIAAHDLSDVLHQWIEGSPEASDTPYDNSDFAPALPGEACHAMAAESKGLAFEQYCVDLSAQACAGGIDPVIGRELEIRTMIDVLLRRRQNNPLLTGEAGVGKTAVVEGLALAIAAGNVPAQLTNVRLCALDVGALLAGASMKGEFEARLKSVLESASQSSRPIILFIDEIHTLMGAGGQAGVGDAANLLKPALARGTIRTIGATTWSEYKRHIEKDPALTRRFQVLQIAEPDECTAIDMVRGLAKTFSQHHGVLIRDAAIRAAVTLSHRYIPSRQLPDKAISLLDTACARVALSQHAAPRELDAIRQQLAAARTERMLLAQEAQFGLDACQALATAEARIDALMREETEIDVCWKQQAAAAQALLARREAVRADANQNDGNALISTDALRELDALERTLARLQAAQPLVFPEVSETMVAKIVSDWTGIPAGRMVTDEVAAIRLLPETLEARVIGQTDALRQISERVQTARAGLTDPKKPIGVFLLCGPSGVGKTETALALAEALYGGEQNLITINMSEYQEAHTVSGLKGAPPGYVGYGEGGILTEAVRRRPYSVVLLDEIEKAHHDVHEMFFQVFDKGYMEDGDGRYIDFRNTTILLTSNVGADLTATWCAHPSRTPDGHTLRDVLTPQLLKIFPPAFIGRVTVVPYLPLTDTVLTHIVRLHLDHAVKRMVDHHDAVVTYDDAVVDYIVARCLTQDTGARVLIGFIEQHILPRLSMLWLDAFSSNQTLTHIAISILDAFALPAQALVFKAAFIDSGELLN